MSHGIWQILLKAGQPGAETDLTCDECFAILVHFADRAVEGDDMARV